MTRWLFSLTMVLGLFCVESSWAQSSTFGRPSASNFGAGGASSAGFSPYLNLQRGGGSAASNYYGIVRPVQDLRASVSGLQQGFDNFNGANQDTGANSGGAIVTGTRPRFMNTSNYFLNFTGGTGTGISSSRSGTGQGGATLGQGLTGGAGLMGGAGARGGSSPRR